MASVDSAPGIPDATTVSGVPLGIEVKLSGMRSTNIERDLNTLDVSKLWVNARIQDVLGRVVSAIEDPARSRVWSLTGPYGSGKSTVALLTGALLSKPGPRRQAAEEVLRAAHGKLADRLAAARDQFAPNGFIVAAAAARRESITDTLARALLKGANRYWDGRPPRKILDAFKALGSADSTHAQLTGAVRVLCREAPVLLVIDEFGKSLEYFAAESDKHRNDIYLLQELAELAGGRAGLPLFIVTLQHLSFNDYAANSTALQRREWAKIQGRFEDVVFSPDPTDSIRLMKSAVHPDQVGPGGRQLIRAYAEQAAILWSEHGLNGLLPGDAGDFTALYPVHPLTAIAVPLVAAQVGQHDRSLAGFLTGDEPFTVHRFVQEHAEASPARAASVRLAQAYDYFFASGRTTILASVNASRWIEIDQIISEAHGLDAEEILILKTIGVLNLIDVGGSLRASKSLIHFALNDPAADPEQLSMEALSRRLDSLIQRGSLVHRKFSDEYRIWRGSDVEIEARLAEYGEKIDDRTTVKALRASLPAAVVAGRHSQTSGFLRNFLTVATSSKDEPVQAPPVGGGADGLLIFHFGDCEDIPQVESKLPVVAGISKEARRVLDIQRELIALRELADRIAEDAVARREVEERAGQFRVELARAFNKAFNPATDGTEWYLLSGAGKENIKLQNTRQKIRSLATVVSMACDKAFPDTPKVRNEMLGRHQLTSQGAKARRELISAMVTDNTKERLGLGGHGPEVAIYEGVLRYMDLHKAAGTLTGLGEVGRTFGLAEPTEGTPLYPAWQALRARLKATSERSVAELYDLLAAPPYGIKAGVIPVIVTAALLLFRESVAVFEEGTYKPSLTDDLMERLVKAPERYTAKYISVSEGARRQALAELVAGLGIKVPAANGGSRLLLTVTSNILNELRMLSAYAKKTRQVSRPAIAVRQAIMEARDPDDFIFAALPCAVGLESFKVGDKEDQERASEYVAKLFGTLDELRNADKALRESVIAILAKELRTSPELPELRRDLRIRVAPFADAVAEPEMSGFIDLALNEVMADEDWLNPVVVRLVRTGLPSWSDDHIRQFERAARRISAGLDRLASLHVPNQSEATDTGELQLVTHTSPDGHANSVLVHIPEKIREDANRLAESVLAAAEAQLGIDGRRVLLAALAALVTSPGAKGTGEADGPVAQLFHQEES